MSTTPVIAAAPGMSAARPIAATRDACCLALAALVLVGCGPSSPIFPGGVVTGTWGGSGAVFMADDTSAHEHIGCTYGNVHAPTVEDATGHFDVTGEQDITAYPLDRGILHPARFSGVIFGNTMTLTVTLTDTAVTLGPVSLSYGTPPTIGPCPICAVKPAGRRGLVRLAPFERRGLRLP